MTLRQYGNPDDPASTTQPEEAQRIMAYSFSLLHVSLDIPSIQLWKLLTFLDVGILSLQRAQNVGSEGLDMNSFLVVTDSEKIPQQLVNEMHIPRPPNREMYHRDDPTRPSHHHTHGPLVQPKRPQHYRQSHLHWRTQERKFVPPQSTETQTITTAITHETGTQAAMLVDYGTTTERRTVAETEPTTTGVEQLPRPTSTAFPDQIDMDMDAAEVTVLRVSPRPWSSHRDQASPDPTQPAHTADLNSASSPGGQQAPCTAQSEHDWEMTDQLHFPRMKQPVPISPPATTLPATQTARNESEEGHRVHRNPATQSNLGIAYEGRVRRHGFVLRFHGDARLSYTCGYFNKGRGDWREVPLTPQTRTHPIATWKQIQTCGATPNLTTSYRPDVNMEDLMVAYLQTTMHDLTSPPNNGHDIAQPNACLSIDLTTEDPLSGAWLDTASDGWLSGHSGGGSLLGKVNYTPGAPHIVKEILWTEVLASLTDSSVMLVHRNDNHFDPMYYFPPSLMCDPSEPQAEPRPQTELAPPWSWPISLPPHERPPPPIVAKPKARTKDTPVSPPQTHHHMDARQEYEGFQYVVPT
ncbi:hypothetical protein H257_11120 [Aphanomyces astaci]|uniref:Uncharacterized protein n=1 Tax=Aphanomyces astaci TaxID=112090 RepID=W4G551_APHAT|nr:hypothetical protein H257_11120 [Aphanomyces astaci]ETV74154.1 hypothetical protein H257_11120 [Aphanomyces astaci]|eukprot:XP_009836260.1 hypothetical protein H257_11120 [Aphanomyces astaci]